MQVSGISPSITLQTSAFSVNRSLDSLTASRMSFVVALVLIPETSNGDFALFLKMIEKVSPGQS